MRKIGGGFLFAVLLFGVIITVFIASEPESKKKLTIGVVNPNPGNKETHLSFIDSIRTAAEKEGWLLSFIICEEKEEIDSAIQEMVQRQVDMIFSVTTPATKKVKKAIAGQGIAGIFAIYDPVQSGVIESLRHPGGDLTGVQIRGSVAKNLDWLLTVAPNTKHIYVPIRLDTKAAPQSLKDLRDAAQLIDIRLTIAEVNNEAELDKALLSIPADADAVFLLHSMLISTHAQKIVDMANARKITSVAAIGKSREGTLICFSPNLSKIGKQAGRIALEVLRGEAPGNVPAEMAEFVLGINLQSAGKIGLEVPHNILILADYIVR
ncbi:MAG: ABC transporter substrate-binding protein [Desulfobulbaceae bacterium]|nr:ABC transporter substrate-binding protein [Desulfobulbaceae bacterium]